MRHREPIDQQRARVARGPFGQQRERQVVQRTVRHDVQVPHSTQDPSALERLQQHRRQARRRLEPAIVARAADQVAKQGDARGQVGAPDGDVVFADTPCVVMTKIMRLSAPTTYSSNASSSCEPAPGCSQRLGSAAGVASAAQRAAAIVEKRLVRPARRRSEFL